MPLGSTSSVQVNHTSKLHLFLTEKFSLGVGNHILSCLKKYLNISQLLREQHSGSIKSVQEFCNAYMGYKLLLEMTAMVKELCSEQNEEVVLSLTE